ncbi:sigma-70 family RNA polymerase sigma factor [Echinicola marina]|uniref:RNA polymerase sigma factor n=1 Tax=Echinicola marina TaxID=2859768 RepID=UPI001CF66B0A|nr:sigma-70 family RNA polymerase sigma factor [Echinicola marina]UCS95438.1 sigma-70 family RNA polymerase sigma factor [Echinicola marina]
MPLIKVSYCQKEDHQLWIDMKSGDRLAFDHIFNVHVGHLQSYGQSFTSDEHIIDDCLQEVFCRIWQKRTQLKVTDNIRYYLMAAFRKELLKTLKRNTKRYSLIGRLLPDSSIDFNAKLETSFMEEDSRQEQMKILNQCFKKLSSRQKEIVYLKYYNGLSFDEVSQILGLTKKSVYNALSKAMMILRKNMSA